MTTSAAVTGLRSSIVTTDLIYKGIMTNSFTLHIISFPTRLQQT